MRLGLNLGYLAGGDDPAGQLRLARHAEDLGFDAVWAAEAYGADSPTTLAWLAGQTERVQLGSAVMQIPARTPAMTAMTAAGLDLLSGGRFRLGLGVSGPQVSEGWHGVRFAHPLTRTREYVEVVRLALSGKPVAYEGQHYQLPLPDGPGKALRITVPVSRERPVPVYLAAVGPKNLELAGEIADGWLAVFFAPSYAGEQLARVRVGRERAAAARGGTGAERTSAGEPVATHEVATQEVTTDEVATHAIPPGPDPEGDPGSTSVDPMDGFDVVPTVPLVVGSDPVACADPVRPYAALYVGGMGSRDQNFYNALAVRMGFGQAAGLVQDHFLARRYRDSAAAVPYELIDSTSLLGPVARLTDRLVELAAAGVTSCAVSPYGATVEQKLAALTTVAEALDRSGVAG